MAEEKLVIESYLSATLKNGGPYGNAARAFVTNALCAVLANVLIVHGPVFASGTPAGIYGFPAQIELLAGWAIIIWIQRTLFGNFFSGIVSTHEMLTKYACWDSKLNGGLGRMDVFWVFFASWIGQIGGWVLGASIGFGYFNGSSEFTEELVTTQALANSAVSDGGVFVLLLVGKLLIDLVEAVNGQKENHPILIGAANGLAISTLSGIVGPSLNLWQTVWNGVIYGDIAAPFGTLAGLQVASELVAPLVAVILYAVIFKCGTVKKKAKQLKDKASALTK